MATIFFQWKYSINISRVHDLFIITSSSFLQDEEFLYRFEKNKDEVWITMNNTIIDQNHIN